MGATSSRLAVLAFTDVVGSTDLKARLGDAAAGELLERHNALVRQALADAAGGTILKDTGDGFLLQFGTPSDAARFALLLQALMARQQWGAHAVTARVGVHVGEVFQSDLEPDGSPRIVGLAVDTASRVTSLAQPRQILLTQMAFESARHNVREHPPVDGGRAPQIRWVSHGPYQLQGLNDAIEICEVGAVGIAPLSAPPDGEKGRRAVAAREPTAPPPPLAYATPQRSRHGGLRVLAIGLVVVMGCGTLAVIAGLFLSAKPVAVPIPKTVQTGSPLPATTQAAPDEPSGGTE